MSQLVARAAAARAARRVGLMTREVTIPLRFDQPATVVGEAAEEPDPDRHVECETPLSIDALRARLTGASIRGSGRPRKRAAVTSTVRPSGSVATARLAASGPNRSSIVPGSRPGTSRERMVAPG